MASIPFFEWFNNVLLTSANSVPIQSLWTAFFVNPVDLNRAAQAGAYENGFGYISLVPGAIANTAQGANGALFANSVSIPGDGMNVSKLGVEQSGLIKGNISNGRNEMENLNISFLDTNMSFVDYNIRPWTIYASHKSLKDPSIKTTIVVIQWSKTGPEKALSPRGIWTYHDACPVSIKTEEWNYGDDNVISRQVEFSYNYYLFNANPINALQTVTSVISDSTSEQKYQPKEVSKGGLDDGSHGGGQLVNINPDDNTEANGHKEGQPVVIPEDDMIDRGLDIGLDILAGNSNVTIASDDAIRRLQIQGEELRNRHKVPEEDTPNHTGPGKQEGHIYEEPVGNRRGLPDHIKRHENANEQSGKVPVSGNSKASTKALSDTPLFFPGDGDENDEKIGGRTVGGELDTVEVLQLKTQQVVVEKTGDVGKNIPLQIITIKKDDNGKGGNKTSQLVEIERNDVIDTHEEPHLVTIKSVDKR